MGMGKAGPGCGKCSGPDPDVMVVQRMCNHSAFNGYHRTPSDWSSVRCLWCDSTWRTKAKYVSVKPDAPPGWQRMSAEEARALLRPDQRPTA
jgi:hypothetical protein